MLMPLKGHVLEEVPPPRSSPPPPSSRPRYEGNEGQGPLSRNNMSFIDKAMARPHTTWGSINILLVGLEDAQEEDGVDVSPVLQDALLESLGTTHFCQGSAGSSAEVEPHNNDKE
ncbi:hypothetical protein HAX54_019857 [Datura stramonium]|uniref:Uncharacterized protein n=1 Tax=Datura stramonium TaxID=4076 RepID=A0ABS8USE8_DATST|nr:hypothetical protein [Datura stramonium]